MVFTEEERKERKKERERKYYENNKEKFKEKKAQQTKEYCKTPKGKERHTIASWKYAGVIHDNFEELYNKYLDTTECDVCKYVFDESNWRCMDHDHDTGLFRQFLCYKCNVHDTWKNK